MNSLRMKDRHDMTVFSRKAAAAVYSAVILLMIFGTFYDADVSSALYRAGSPYGVFIEGFAHVPCLFCGAGCIGLFLRALEHVSDEQKTRVKILTALCCAGCASVYVMLFLNIPFLLFCPSVILLSIAAGSFTRFVKENCPADDPGRLLRTGIVILAAILIEIALIFLIKIPWGRPRWRTVTAVSGLEFRAWYQPSLTLKTPYLRMGIPADEFKSFPSGHTGNAAAALLMALFADFIPALKKRRSVIISCAFLWIVMTMIGRIAAGAHFVSDTAAGLCISYTVFLLLLGFFRKKFPGDIS